MSSVHPWVNALFSMEAEGTFGQESYELAIYVKYDKAKLIYFAAQSEIPSRKIYLYEPFC